MYISLLNHACVKICFRDGTKILTDPWLQGFCFSEGWNLKYENVSAWKELRDCTHLWISHFHVSTLRELLTINPEIKVFGNNSYNFQLDTALKNIGFKNVYSIYENKQININNNISLIRLPCSGIDNMLLIKCPEGNILNYNDCNLPREAIESYSKAIGSIDLLLANFNHASKILEYPFPQSEDIKIKQKQYFQSVVRIFKPIHTIPFASFHSYRTSEGIIQNKSLLNNTDLSDIESVIPLMIGQTANISNLKNGYTLSEINDSVAKTKPSLKNRPNVSIDEIINSNKIFCKKINIHYLYLTFLIPGLKIRIVDLNIIVAINIFKSTLKISNKNNYHISSTSFELNKWFLSKYGTDSFWVGCHFNVNSSNNITLRIILILALLIENRLCLSSMIKMLFSFNGLKFLFNRRREIIAILSGLK